MNNDRSFEKKPYTIVIDAYKEKNGILMPTRVKAIWNLENRVEYWKGTIKEYGAYLNIKTRKGI